MGKRIKAPESNRFDCTGIEVSVEYRKGGYFALMDIAIERGIYIHMEPTYFKPYDAPHDKSETCITLYDSRIGDKNGVAYFIKGLKMKGRKAIEKAEKLVEPYSEKLAEAYLNNDKSKMQEIIREIKGIV